jgi:uncharacterized protein YacL
MIADYVEILLLAFILVVLSINGVKTLPKRKQGGVVIVDSCGLIDGRILELVSAGFVRGRIVIPQFILNELQLLADGNDSQKRERARFGLDVANKLMRDPDVHAVVDTTNQTRHQAIDEKLLVLAKKRKAQLYTIDFNLNKRASAEGVDILNVNELAQLLRPTALPGEVKEVKIVERGSNKDQGVGYLDDGTMVVVDHAAKYRGKKLQVVVSRSLQTMAGKMMFANLKGRQKEN